MSAHTKGPWVYEPGDWWVYGPQDPRSNHKNGRVCIAQIATDYMPPHTIRDPEALANARLIAAAPELLEVAQMVVREYAEADPNYRPAGFYSARNAAIRAIAKATGEQP